tara:strand:+ start:35564 stop:35743 length:180 start_codon:yes stop_codon:yes gene_type:complete
MDKESIDGNISFPLLSRVEVIDESGRLLTLNHVKNVTLSTQDGGKTLKVFLTVFDKEKE